MAVYQTKELQGGVLDVDNSTRRVKVAIAEMESIDRDGDVFTPTAFNKTIKERGPQGTNEIWHLVDHSASLKSALGKFSELYVDGKYLVGVSERKDAALWEQIWPLYEAGDITQHSVGFTTIHKEAKAGHTVITEVQLWEGSAVLWGANPNTPTLQVEKSLFGIEEKADKIERLNALIKAVKGGRYDVDSLSLLAIELKQLQQFIQDSEAAESTSHEEQPPAGTTPDKSKELLLYTQILNKQISF